VDKILTGLVDQFLDSYAECGGINHIDGSNLPSKAAIAQLTLDLLELQFPGFHTDEPLSKTVLPDMTLENLKSLHERLTIEIRKSLDYRPPLTPKDPAAIAYQFLSKLVDLRVLLQTDVEAAYEGDPAAISTEEVMVAYPGIEAIAVQRMAHLLYLEGVALIPRMMTEWAHSRTGIDIHPGATIGRYFFIDHGTGVVVGETTIIGDHVRIYQGVGMVARSLASHIQRDPAGTATGGKRHPTIGNNVTIYAGATIIGGDTVIGDGCIIGGNVWLTHSVPSQTVVYFEGQGMRSQPRGGQGVLDWQI
jgi:serine O-acetyltransferase